MFKRKFPLMDGTPGAAGGGAPAGDGALAAPAAPAGTPPAAPAADAGAGALAAAPSILSGGKPEEGVGAASAAPNDWIPEKFRVMNGDAMDVEASAKKLAESYAGLEKRVGSGDVPPKTAEDYAITVPEEFKDVWAEDDRFKAFRTDALAAGMTQKQFDLVMGKYFTMVPDLVQGGQQVSADKATEELRTTWKTDTEFKANVQDAFKAFSAYADPADQARIDEIGNSPVALRILAKIGKEMGEAGGIPAANSSTGADDIQTILKSDAYLNPKHPDHKTTSAKVQAFYQRKYGNAPA
jgi:hypothetical protein